MRILLVTTSYPTGQAGSEAAGTFVRDLARALGESARVSVVAPALHPAPPEKEDAVTVYRYPSGHLPLSTLNPVFPRHWPRILATLRAGGRMVEAVLRDSRIDHIIALWTFPSGYWAMKVGGRNGVPYSVWALGSDIWTLGRMPGVRWLLRQILARAANRFADGYQLCDDVTRLGGSDCGFLPSSRRLESACDPRERPASPPYRLAYLGRWHPNKGIDLLLEALSLLGNEEWRRIEEIRIAGGGPLGSLVEGEVAKLSEEGRPVTRLGFLGKEAAAALLDWADYLVIPSRIESIPVVFSDALQRRCPIIATPVGDLPRLYRKSRFGVLAERASAEALSAAIGVALRRAACRFQHALDPLRSEFELERVSARLLDTLFRQEA